MGILTRFFNVIRAQINQWLDKAEDPAAILNQMMIDLDTQKRQAKEQVTEALASQKKLEKDLIKQREEVGRWESRAVIAVQKGEDELAKEALVRKNEHLRYVTEYEQQLSVHKKNTDALRVSYNGLEKKVEEIQRKKGLLIAKKTQADAQRKIYQTIEGMDGRGAIATVERMEQKIDDMQSKSEAYQELSQEHGDTLERKFAALQTSDADVESELLALKKRALLENQPS